MDNNINREEYWFPLITAYLSGSISATDKLLLEDWIGQSEDHAVYFHQIKIIYDSLDVANRKSAFNDEQAYDLFRQRVQAAESPQTVKNIQTYTRRSLIRIAAVAASIALIVGLSFSWFNKPAEAAPGKVLVEAPSGQKSRLYLPDGTEVWLNSGSQLTYFTDFNTGNRDVLLDGEAFFDVSKNPALPFHIVTHGVRIEVLGTSFNVSSYSNEKDITVSLLEGSVSVMNATDGTQLAALSPGQKLSVNKYTHDHKLTACNADMDGIWRHGKLRIDNDPLSEVIAKMERWYGVDIEFEGKPSNERYWMTIKTESLTEILELINKITPINYQIKGEEVTIRYK